MDNIKKINIINNKIIFLGYGAVAKCVWNYFDFYFIYEKKNVYIIDQYKEALYGPKICDIPSINIIIKHINCFNFDNLIVDLKINENDIIIDLTYNSNTYYFINKCLIFGINYINTSIEDNNDKLLGTSIELQQQIVNKIYKDYINTNNIVKCNILTEFGQNPGLIQHYILYALNQLNQLYNNNKINDYSIPTLIKVIDNYKIGTILSSEIDNLTLVKDNKNTSKKIINSNKRNVIDNTWSVVGLMSECLDEVEMVYGSKNKFIKPYLDKQYINYNKNSLLDKTDYNIIFLKESGINCVLNSICPVLDNNNNIVYQNYDGRLIHHGEMFEFAKLFGDKTPFMCYVYKINKYAEESIKKYVKSQKKNIEIDIMLDLKLWVINNPKNYNVFDNILESSYDKIIGHDSIGCTIFCGDSKIERIFWCGSILSDIDDNINSLFTPTIIQVATGVLAGLSYILEPENKFKGLLNPCDLDTDYILQKCIPLLGKFFFTEIPNNLFSEKKLKVSFNKII